MLPSLPPAVAAALSRYWGFASLRPLQDRAIAAALAGRDSLVVLPTGGGKSLCYQLPAVVRGGLTVVVSPLIALMKDQVDGLARAGVAAARLDSSLAPAELSAAYDQIRRGELRLVFTSPERLVNTESYRTLRDAGTHSVAIDEAHCVSHWGHDFRPEYRQLAKVHDMFPGAAVHGYTATATPQVRADIAAQLGLRDPELLVGNFDRPNLTYRVLPLTDVTRQVRGVIDRHRGDAGIVYCLRRKDVDAMKAALAGAGVKAVAYHAGMTADARREAQDAFTREDADVVVATVAFGMGIDRSNVRYVVHAALPKSLEHYQQETGRAGRDGLPSECVLFYSGGDYFTLKSIIEKSAEEANAAPEFLAASLDQLNKMGRYARGAACRHKALVNHFGQEYATPNCTACDICLGDTTDVPDAVLLAQKILSCVARVKESFGMNHVIDVLRGANTEAIRGRGHDQLSTYGLLKDVPKSELRDYAYQLVGQGALAISDGEYPILKLTAASWEVMKGQRAVRLIKLAEEPAAKAAAALPADADPALFETLRQLRRQEAARLNVPPYVVFPDTVLAEFARIRPSSPVRMRAVSGVGDKKLREFGDTFLAAIRTHCQKTGAAQDVSPAALIKVAPKGPHAPPKMTANRAAAFALFRGEASVADAMHQLGLARATVSDFLADFVRAESPASIFAWVPEDVCERVAAAAETHGRERLKPVFLALNEEVSYDDIRVVFAFLAGRPG